MLLYVTERHDTVLLLEHRFQPLKIELCSGERKKIVWEDHLKKEEILEQTKVQTCKRTVK